jgi:exosortase
MKKSMRFRRPIGATRLATPLQLVAGVAWAVALGVSLIWLYGSVLGHLGREWVGSADASYGLVMVGVALAVAWNRRAMLTRTARADSGALPLALVVFGLLACVLGQLAADVFVTRTSFIVVLAGMIGFVAGRTALRALAAPLLFLLIAIPLPALIVNAVTLPLQFVASRFAEAALAAASVPVFRDGNLLLLPSGTLEVAQACSGLRSAISLTAIAIVLAWSLTPNDGLRGAARRIALAASAIPVAVVMNGLRIAATGVAVESWGPAAARDPWHELMGWLTFVASVGVLLAIRRVVARGGKIGNGRRDLVAA